MVGTVGLVIELLAGERPFRPLFLSDVILLRREFVAQIAVRHRYRPLCKAATLRGIGARIHFEQQIVHPPHVLRRIVDLRALGKQRVIENDIRQSRKALVIGFPGQTTNPRAR